MRVRSRNSRAGPCEVAHYHAGHRLLGKKLEKASVHSPVGQVLRHTKGARVSRGCHCPWPMMDVAFSRQGRGVQGTKPLLSLWLVYQPGSQCLYCKPAHPRLSLSVWKRRTAW